MPTAIAILSRLQWLDNRAVVGPGMGSEFAASSVVVAPTSNVHQRECIEPSGKQTNCAPALAARSAKATCVAIFDAVCPLIDRIDAQAIVNGAAAWAATSNLASAAGCQTAAAVTSSVGVRPVRRCWSSAHCSSALVRKIRPSTARTTEPLLAPMLGWNIVAASSTRAGSMSCFEQTGRRRVMPSWRSLSGTHGWLSIPPASRERCSVRSHTGPLSYRPLPIVCTSLHASVRAPRAVHMHATQHTLTRGGVQTCSAG